MKITEIVKEDAPSIGSGNFGSRKFPMTPRTTKKQQRQ